MAMLVDGVGVLVPIKDVEAMAMALDQIEAIPLDVSKMRDRACKFSVEATVPEWIKLFETLPA